MFENKEMKVGIAPIGWSNDDMPELGADRTFEQCISEIALAGFDGTEVGGKFPHDPVQLREAMELREIEIASQWFSSFLISTPYEENERAFVEKLDFLESVGAKRVNICELTNCLFASEKSMFGRNKPLANDEEWEWLCKGLNKLGEIATKRGFKLCYHHHMATVVQTIAETKRLLENTDPRYVHLCFDSGHFALAGEDPLKAAELFSDRIAHVHLKDIRKAEMEEAVQEGFRFRGTVLTGCFTIPGDGFIDFPRLLQILDKSAYQGWLLIEAEQNPDLANPLEYAMKARAYIRAITGI
ncbi:myo-inosose-2 dehydratase [Listeria valentina]|uniref:myo-inosose-2 dehydratase n=1 Tax=Listeria valentina TaxID=2705293 RepID=UPI0014302AD8|nr:myo-inosose-2 dehydratase [Listeria valentina]